ncbi:cupin domain-containing protein [uncultured Flavobacterium sp.]|uniref:cupin domain-containing protein n=1 Tax=uncultured Flavobacterium sp. TaxID=165435 RepID=UPI0026003AD2|nr:cupin domain-containing protein [uncultured Flavobacterium sp.]
MNNSNTSLSIAGNTYRILISGKDTGGAYAVIDMLVPPGGGPGPHEHPGIWETFHVLEGEVEFTTGTTKHIARKGEVMSIPLNGPVHFFRNRSNKLAHLVCTVAPAGLEAFFTEIGSPVAHGEFLAPQPPTPEEMEKIQAAAKKHGQVLYPPDSTNT